jgi:hypothetical protein
MAKNLEREWCGRRANAEQDGEIIQRLAERGVEFQTVAAQAGKPDADPFDLLCHLDFNAPASTRRQHAYRVKKHHAALFAYFAPEAREIENGLLLKYAGNGELPFTPPGVLKVPLTSHHGSVNEIIGKIRRRGLTSQWRLSRNRRRIRLQQETTFCGHGGFNLRIARVSTT